MDLHLVHGDRGRERAQFFQFELRGVLCRGPLTGMKKRVLGSLGARGSSRKDKKYSTGVEEQTTPTRAIKK